jgi:hypothetical protein
LTADEFERAIGLLSNSLGFERLKDRFVRSSAFTSKRGLGSPKALADRLHMLSGGLRREAPATYAFHAAWNETFASHIREEDEKALGDAADRVNASLTDGKEIDPEKEPALDAALGEYHSIATRSLGGDAAYLDMLLKAVPAVAERIRSWSDGRPPAPHKPPDSEAPATTDEPEDSPETDQTV